MRRAALALFLSTCLAGAAAAQLVPPLNSQPEADAEDRHDPGGARHGLSGTIQLTVDATDVTRGIFNVHERVPVTGRRRFRSALSKWLPGDHSPAGRSTRSRVSAPRANGQQLKWMRDTLDVYAFHVTVPQGVSAIDVDFQYVSPTADNQGRDRHDAGHGEHPVDRQFDVPGRLFRPRHSRAGVGHRPGRLEGRHRASPERRKPATASIIR